MPGQDHLHIVREVFAAWNAHDLDAFIKRLDTKVTWESDAFPGPFTGHDGARQFLRQFLPPCARAAPNAAPARPMAQSA
jgi:ketosteroid isomerase-like protein